MIKVENIHDQARSYGELGSEERHKILEEILVQHRLSGKGARSLVRWVLEKFKVHIPAETVEHWLLADTPGKSSRVADPEPRSWAIRPYMTLSLAEREQVYRKVMTCKRFLRGVELQKWVVETCGVWVTDATLYRWCNGSRRPRQLFWPAAGHNTSEDWQAMRAIYHQVRTGARKKFPPHFWTDPGAHARAVDLLRYLAEECLGWSYEDTVLLLTRQILVNQHLSGALLRYSSLAKLIRAAYPNQKSLAELCRQRAARSFVTNHNRERNHMFEGAKALLGNWGVFETELQADWPLLQQACTWLAAKRRRYLQASTIAKLFLAILRAKRTKYAPSYQQILQASGYRDTTIYKLQKQLVFERVIQDNATAKRQHFFAQAQKCLYAAHLPKDVHSEALDVFQQLTACQATQSIKKPSILAGVALKVALHNIGSGVSTNQVAKLVGASYIPKAIVNDVLKSLRGAYLDN